MIDDEEDDELEDDRVRRVHAALLARLRQLHADPGGEWQATIGPLTIFACTAVARLAVLTGERDGLADLMAKGAEPRIIDEAADALTSVWVILVRMAADAEEVDEDD